MIKKTSWTFCMANKITRLHHGTQEGHYTLQSNNTNLVVAQITIWLHWWPKERGL
jgi:hypothetical protein